jgi:hypothetical protein
MPISAVAMPVSHFVGGLSPIDGFCWTLSVFKGQNAPGESE